MTPRARKLAGTVLLLLFVAMYSLLAMAAAIVLEVQASKGLELAYYFVAGLAWIVPAGLIIKWMQKD